MWTQGTSQARGPLSYPVDDGKLGDFGLSNTRTKQFDPAVTTCTITPVRPRISALILLCCMAHRLGRALGLVLIAYALEPMTPLAEDALRSLQSLGFGFSLHCQLLLLRSFYFCCIW